MRTPNGTDTHLSSHAYISMVPRDPEDDYPAFSNGKLQKMQVPIADLKHCDHTAYVCPTKTCTESWGIDHILLLETTVAGRRFKKILE